MPADSPSERRARVYATRRLPGEAFRRLADQVELDVWPGPGGPPGGELLERARTAEGLVCTLTDEVGAPLLDACPRLRVISSCSVGVDHVDLVAATARGIPVGHTPGVLTEATADLAFALLLAAARRIPEADAFVRSGSWTPERRWDPELMLGRDLAGATLGLVGLGAIGRAVAQRARGFGMHVVGWTRSRRRVGGVEAVDLPDLWRRSTFLSVHVASTPETQGLIGAAELASMPPGSVLVNTSRGGIVDEEALTAALRSGHLAAAGLDVFAHEPLPRSSPLVTLPNVVLAPHIGSATAATRERMTELTVANLLAGLQGGPLPHCANPGVDGSGRRG